MSSPRLSLVFCALANNVSIYERAFAITHCRVGPQFYRKLRHSQASMASEPRLPWSPLPASTHGDRRTPLLLPAASTKKLSTRSSKPMPRAYAKVRRSCVRQSRLPDIQADLRVTRRTV